MNRMFLAGGLILTLAAGQCQTSSTGKLVGCALSAALAESIALSINARWRPGMEWRPLRDAALESANIVWEDFCFPSRTGLGVVSLPETVPPQVDAQLIVELERIGADPALLDAAKGEGASNGALPF